jgi:glycosyltransferase A (GT-A) superfamily protein (DUF2064 family)
VSTIIVIAKAPVPGRVKTRLTPPCTPSQAAWLAEAALADTLDAVAAAGARRTVLALDGAPGEWLPAGFDVVAQRGDGLADRLAAAFEDAGGPALLVGMDTPQLTPQLLRAALARPCALGLAADGGWWGLTLPAPDPQVFAGVPMSADDTGARQLARLRAVGYAPTALPVLRDVDTIADARAVAALAPHTRFAAAVGALDLQAAA